MKIAMTEYLQIDLDSERWHCRVCNHDIAPARDNYKEGLLVYARDPREIHKPILDATKYEFTFGFPFNAPTALDNDCFELGLTEKSQQDIPPLRAAARLALSVEGRRAQPMSQGDSRRPEEVPMTASVTVAREFSREYREAVMAERSRLQALFGFQMRVGDEP